MSETMYQPGDKVVIKEHSRRRYPDVRYSVLTITAVETHPKFGYQELTIDGLEVAPALSDLRPATPAEIAYNVQHIKGNDPLLVAELRIADLEDSLEYYMSMEKAILEMFEIRDLSGLRQVKRVLDNNKPSKQSFKQKLLALFKS